MVSYAKFDKLARELDAESTNPTDGTWTKRRPDDFYMDPAVRDREAKTLAAGRQSAEEAALLLLLWGAARAGDKRGGQGAADGHTLLHAACRWGLQGAAEQLLQSEVAKPFTPDAHGVSPLQYALLCGRRGPKPLSN